MANRMLIIDDDPEIATFVGRVAKSVGYHVTLAKNAQDFVEQLQTAPPTHIILDLAMPDVDGVELLRHLAEIASKAKILIASGFEQRVLDVAERLGAARGLAIVGTLTKPIRTEDLRTVLDRVRDDVDWLSASAILEAIAADHFELAFQPKIDIATQVIAGYEALLRWNHPRRGLIAPAAFVPFAESSADLMDRLTDWVTGAAVRQLRVWQAAGLETEVAVNISARNLRDTALGDTLAVKCREAGVIPEQITLELTESAAMGNVVEAMDILTRLRIKGFRLAIDDFGTGFSSLVQLQRLPFSEIKVDRAFVGDCHSSRDSAVIVKTTVDLAHNLGLLAVAEGIEQDAGLALLAEYGCDMAQGYLIARPMRAAAVPDWAREWSATPRRWPAPPALRPASPASPR